MGEVLEATRTPLALAGLVVVVLYGIYSQILRMGIFSQVGADQTFSIVNQIALYLFWLAVLAIVLGGVGYFRSALTKRRS